MKSLVVLNDCGFSEQQINFLKNAFQDVAIYKNTSSQKEAIRRIGKRNIVILDQFILTLDERTLSQCSNIELIIVNTTAYDNIDLNLLKKYKIKLAHLGEYATYDVAENGIAMLFALNHNLQLGRAIVDMHDIESTTYKGRQFVSDIWPGHPVIPHLLRKQLRHQSIGIVGLGRIGTQMATMCSSLGMTILAYNRTEKNIPNIKLVSISKLFETSDIIFISLAYTEELKGFISAQLLDSAKKDSLLISIANASLIDMDHLMLIHSKFRGIGFDYLVTNEVRKLLQVRKYNIIVTPHLGHQSQEAYSRISQGIIETAVKFSIGTPSNLVRF